MVFDLKKGVFVGTAVVAVRLEVRTGIHTEGQALSLRNAFIINRVFQQALQHVGFLVNKEICLAFI
jgi:hypothetical protein